MRLYRLAFLFGMAAIVGCVTHTEESSSQTALKAGEQNADAQPAGAVKKVNMGKNIVLEIQGDKRRVRINAEVCLREGLIEQLLTKKRQKEHEAILAADIDARELHLALTLAGAEPGKPVQFRPKLVAPSGTAVKVFLEYKVKDKVVRMPAQQWIRNIKSKKDFHADWVFAGSILIQDPVDKTKKPYYAANDGDVITVVNFEGACMDVPFLSTKDNADLDFEAHTERIPPLKTAVTVILEPILEKKKR